MRRSVPYTPEAGPASLRIEDLTVRKGGALVLNHISVVIDPGEFVSLVGPSGSGKTTLANYMLGITTKDQPPEGGTVYYGGVNIYGLTPHDREKFLGPRVGYASQLPMLDPRATAMDNICLPGRLKALPIEERFVRALGDVLGIADMLGRPVGPMSGGEQQRVNLLRAFATNPPYVLLDEPTSALNHAGKKAVNDALGVISGYFGSTIITVTHEETSAPRIIEIRDGIVVTPELGGV